MTELKYQLPVNLNTKRLLLSGNAIFTIRNTQTNVHYTFKIHRPKNKQYFVVSLMYDYLKFTSFGYIILTGLFKMSKRTRNPSKHVKVFMFFWQNLGVKTFPPNFKIYHMGQCLKCGRPLTHPESIKRGIGPKCLERS